jgi:signal recognition particle subunit SRP54
VQDLNKLVKQHEQMATVMKRIKKMGLSGMMDMMKGFMGSKDAQMMDTMKGMNPDDLKGLDNVDALRAALENAPTPTSSSSVLGAGMPRLPSMPAGFPMQPKGPLGGLIGQLSGKLKK